MLEYDIVAGNWAGSEAPYSIAVTFSCFIDGVGENLKHRMLAALQIVRAEDDSGTLAHPVLALEHGDAGISVLFQ